MAKVMRYMIADYLKTGSTPSDTYSLMGTGFTTLDENPAAKVEKTPYINDKSASGTITGYENSFAFDTQMISGDLVPLRHCPQSEDRQRRGDGLHPR